MSHNGPAAVPAGYGSVSSAPGWLARPRLKPAWSGVSSGITPSDASVPRMGPRRKLLAWLAASESSDVSGEA